MTMNVAGKTVCVTGTVPGHSRETAEAKLREAGAHTVKTVTKNTHFLITGAGVGQVKVTKAEKLGVVVVPWEQIAWDGGGDDTVTSAAAPPVVHRTFKQIAPMLAVSGELSATDSSWIYEVKWDGVRAVAHVIDGGVGIQSRSAKTDLTKRFPHIAAALTEYPDCIIDGEIVVIEEGSMGGSFQKLANHSNGGSARFVVFDVIECQGENLRQFPFSKRRDLLETIVAEDTTLVAKSPIFEDGDALLAHVRENGLEGMVAKPLDSTYREGHRGPWMKIKVRCEQEFAVVGYKPGEGRFGDTMGALLLAVYDELAGGFVMCGAAGTGFTIPQRYETGAMLDEHADPAIEQYVAMTDTERRQLKREGAVWVRPMFVAQVEFQRWTEDDRLWHPAFKGFRDDKEALEVRREPCVGEGS